MLKIYFKIVLFALPSLMAVYFVCNRYSLGFIDFHYQKITGEGNSLIIGTSRASQGIIPDSLLAGLNYQGPALNFAMTSFDSPFGKEYYRAIKQKINPASKNALFLIEIDLTALITDTTSSLKSTILRDQFVFNGSPNYEYLYRNVSPFYHLFIQNNYKNPYAIVHPNGWLQVELNESQEKAMERARGKAKAVHELLQKSKPSPEAFYWLTKTIQLLKNYGTVVLVRIPAIDTIVNIEKNAFPQLDSMVANIGKNEKVVYWDLTHLSKNYQYIDGNHLTNQSAKKFSSVLNQLLRKP